MDESGNSGFKLDKNQPFFCGTTIISKEDLDSPKFKNTQLKLLKKINLDESKKIFAFKLIFFDLFFDLFLNKYFPKKDFEDMYLRRLNSFYF